MDRQMTYDRDSKSSISSVAGRPASAFGFLSKKKHKMTTRKKLTTGSTTADLWSSEGTSCLPTWNVGPQALEQVAQSPGQYPPSRRESAQHSLENWNLPQGSPTRGWGAVFPRKGRERNELYDKCGAKCFLRPGDKGFPVCPSLSASGGACVLSPQGVQAAKNRAAQYGYTDIEADADNLLARLCSSPRSTRSSSQYTKKAKTQRKRRGTYS